MNNFGLNRESNSGASRNPKRESIPLDHWATLQLKFYFYKVEIEMNMQRKRAEGYNI